MAFLKRLCVILLCFAAFSGCAKLLLNFEKHPRGENPYDPLGPAPPSAEGDGSWLFMVYLDAANNLEPAGVADLAEMCSVDFSSYGGKEITVIVLMDRIAGFSAADGDWKGAKLIRINANGSKTYLTNAALGIWDTSGTNEIDMGNPATLREFIKFAVTRYGTGKDYLLLDLWNHGGGWRNDGDPVNDIRKAICWDDDNGSSSLDLDEAQSAIQQALSAAGRPKLDIVYMDACLMQMVEVNYELRNLTRYLVASEETVPGNGGDYTDILSRYKSNMDGKHTPYLFSYEIVGSYRNQYYTTSDTTQSAVDLSGFSAFMSALDTFAVNLTNAPGARVKDARNATKSFAAPDQVDLYHFVKLVNEKVSGGVAGATEVMSSLEALMVKEYHHSSSMADCHGLAVYFPANPSQVDVPNYCNDGARDMVADGKKWVNFIRWWKKQ